MDSPVSDPPSPLQSSTRSRTRGDHSKRSHKDKTSLASTSKELVRLLVHEEQESQDLRNMLHDLTERLKDETQRADNAEQRARELVIRFKEANEGRLAAQQDTARVSEELRLYKLQLENAQREILRAQELLDTVEAQRHEAEEAAARARTTARKLKEEKVVQLAREQGRVEGIREGIERGRVAGYEEGRAEGYSRGRSAAEKELVRNGYMAGEGTETQDVAVAAPPSPSSSPPLQRGNPAFAPPEAIHVHPPPPSTTSPGPPSQRDIRSASVLNMPPSPQHNPPDYLPDGWVPVIDPDQRIRLPPPHEMAPAPYSPRDSPPQLYQQSMPDLAHESPALMIPPPADRHDTYSETDSMTASADARRQRAIRRRKSSDSTSTTFSQFDLTGPPGTSSTRSYAGNNRANVLSAIVEERSSSVAPSSYTPPRSTTPVLPIPVPVTMPTPQAPAPLPLNHGFIPAPQHEHYTRPGSRSSPESINRNSPAQALDRQMLSPKGSVLSSNSYNITVEPPSRPESGRSGTGFTQDGLLSATDAEHPPPAPASSSEQQVSPQPIIISSNQLPPGFVMSGPVMQTPRQEHIEPVHMPRQAAENHQVAPPPSAAPPSIYQFYAPPAGSASVPPQPTGPVVIPPPSNANVNRYSRSALRESSSDSDDGVAVSSQLSSSSMDSFTTPPDRRKPLAPASYAVAPTPPNVIYPVPQPRSGGPHSSTTARGPSSAGSPHTSVAARVPLPQSSVGSPRSIYTGMSRPGGSAAGGNPSALQPDITGRSNQSPPPMFIPSGMGRP